MLSKLRLTAVIFAATFSGLTWAGDQDHFFQAPEDGAEDLIKTDPLRLVDLEAALRHLNFESPARQIDYRLVLDMSGSDLDSYVQAELLVLKNIYQNADFIESALVFRDRFDELDHVGYLLINPEPFFIGHRARALKFTYEPSKPYYSLEAKRSLCVLAHEAFALTLIALANRHPFLILRDPRVIPILTEVLLENPLPLEAFFPFSKRKDFLRDRHRISTLTEIEVNRLLSGRFLPLAASTPEAAHIWNKWLHVASNWKGVRTYQVQRLANRLGLDYNPTAGDQRPE